MEKPVRFPLFTRTLAALGLLAVWPTPSVTETHPPLFTADRDACFGRVYDAAHLKAHPKSQARPRWQPGRSPAICD
jgi:hypothetical protein